MRVLLDACVLYPTATRRLILGAAGAGLYAPLWSPRILEEWTYRAERDGPADAVQIRGEIAVLRAHHPRAEVAPRPRDLARLVLPDPDDVHVLAAAIAGSADAILTFNARDFPRGALAAEGISRLDPDTFLLALRREAPDVVDGIIAEIVADLQARGAPMDPQVLLRRARLNRLARDFR